MVTYWYHVRNSLELRRYLPEAECSIRIENPMMGEQKLHPGSRVLLPGISLLPGRELYGMMSIRGEIVFADMGPPVDGAHISKVASLSYFPLWLRCPFMRQEPDWRSKCRHFIRTTVLEMNEYKSVHMTRRYDVKQGKWVSQMLNVRVAINRQNFKLGISDFAMIRRTRCYCRSTTPQTCKCNQLILMEVR